MLNLLVTILVPTSFGVPSGGRFSSLLGFVVVLLLANLRLLVGKMQGEAAKYDLVIIGGLGGNQPLIAGVFLLY